MGLRVVEDSSPSSHIPIIRADRSSSTISVFQTSGALRRHFRTLATHRAPPETSVNQFLQVKLTGALVDKKRRGLLVDKYNRGAGGAGAGARSCSYEYSRASAKPALSGSIGSLAAKSPCSGDFAAADSPAKRAGSQRAAKVRSALRCWGLHADTQTRRAAAGSQEAAQAGGCEASGRRIACRAMSHVAVAAAAAVAAADDESDGSDAEWAGQFGEMLLFSGSSSSCSSDGADEGGGGGADVAARWRRRRQSPGGRPPSPCSRSPEVVPESTA
eukprot:COSAG01_NODE_1657_length_9590_cov_441.132336_1_plen_272_part_10